MLHIYFKCNIQTPQCNNTRPTTLMSTLPQTIDVLTTMIFRIITKSNKSFQHSSNHLYQNKQLYTDSTPRYWLGRQAEEMSVDPSRRGSRTGSPDRRTFKTSCGTSASTPRLHSGSNSYRSDRLYHRCGKTNICVET